MANNKLQSCKTCWHNKDKCELNRIEFPFNSLMCKSYLNSNNKLYFPNSIPTN